MANDDIVKCPEGVTLSLHLFIRSDTEDLDIEYTVNGLPALPTKFEHMVDLSKIKLPPLATDWRVMTRKEIAEYKARERADEAARPDVLVVGDDGQQ